MATDAGSRRKDLREALNRTLILDAAEEAFAARGYDGASLRDIAARAGFSSGAVYLFFENKEHLYGQMLARRGEELREAMASAADPDATPLVRLHAMADVAIDFYRQWPHFARLVARAHATVLGSSLSAWEENPDPHVRDQYERAMAFEADIIREGQANGEIRPGDPRALAHLYSVIVNTYLAIGPGVPGDGGGVATDGLSVGELHEIIDSVLRRTRS